MTGGIETAKVDWEADAPRSIFFGDVYFSGDGEAEARHVFIDGNDLPRRFETASRFTIAEIGFGTGLNFLVAWDLWRRTAPDGARLHFMSFEWRPLIREDLARAHGVWPRLAALSGALRRAYPAPAAGVHRLRLDAQTTLTLVLGDARERLPRIEAKADAWFLDGFAPSKNPELWSREVFAEIARLSAPNATAATFTVAGAVRRAAEANGFTVEKRKGFGRKKEMLAARFTGASAPSRRAPWFRIENAGVLAPPARIAIVGGGVAGASLAHELSAAGLAPTIIDRKAIAAGASGNPAGLVMPRIDLGEGASATFFLAAYRHALATIDALGDAPMFNRCGVILKATTEEERSRHRKILAARLLPDEWIEARPEGLFFPQAGVVDPPLYVRALAASAEFLRAEIVSFEHDEDGVEVLMAGGARRRFDAVVIANGCDALRFVEARTLPLSGVMGQVDHFPQARAPAHASAFGPYAAPAPGGGLVIGATYEKIAPYTEPSTTAAATIDNIRAVADMMPEIASSLDAASSIPRASIRCQTPDRLPVAGAAPDWDYFGATYDDLRLGRKRDYPPGRARPRVFILAGLGSRGLVTAPLLAAHVAAEMTGAPSPLELDVAEAVHPARFFIRDLKRSRPRSSKAGTEQEQDGAGE